jgi:hypothetical protein
MMKSFKKKSKNNSKYKSEQFQKEKTLTVSERKT